MSHTVVSNAAHVMVLHIHNDQEKWTYAWNVFHVIMRRINYQRHPSSFEAIVWPQTVIDSAFVGITLAQKVKNSSYVIESYVRKNTHQMWLAYPKSEQLQLSNTTTTTIPNVLKL